MKYQKKIHSVVSHGGRLLCLCAVVVCFSALSSLGANATAQKASAVTSDDSAEKQANNPDIVEYWTKVAYNNFNRGQLRRAINAFERALMEDPDNRDARFGISTIYISMQEYAIAESMLMDLDKDFPNDYSIKNNIAWLYATAVSPAFRSGEKAVSAARSAVLLAPGDYHVWSTLSEAYYVNGEYEQANRAALEAYRLAKESNASLADMHSYRTQVRKCAKAAQAMSLME